MSAQGEGAARCNLSDSVTAQEIIRLERERVEAYTKRDIATLERLLPESFIFTRSVGSFSKSELLHIIESGELTFESFDRQYDAVKVYLNTGVAVGQDRVAGRYKEEDFSGLFRFSNMYVWHEGRWQVVATHSTRIGQ